MLKKILDDNYGFTYTLEAILGVFIIMGAVIFATGNLPLDAHKAGQLSKVQLMNIGRDTIDLTLITPVYETGQGRPAETYILRANKYANIMPGDIVNFTAYIATTNILVNRSLNFNGTTLIISNTSNITAYINESTVTADGNQSWQYVASGIIPNGNYTYSIQAYDSLGVSNFVTIKVGYYDLTSYTTSISGDGDVSGVVTNASGSGIPGLKIQIFDINMNPQPSTPAITDINGTFSFLWSSKCTHACNTGTYFIQAINTTTGNVSNMQVIEYSGGPRNELCASYFDDSSCDNITVLEGNRVSLYMNDYNAFPPTNFYVDYCRDADTSGGSGGYITTNSNGKIATFTANIPGIYSIFIAPPAFSTTNICTGQLQASSQQTNIVLIYVLPVSASPIGDTCVNATELNTYMRRYMPPYVNYNLYLIGPNGSRFKRCPDFPTGQLINGYPTAEAVAVSKLAHIKYEPTKVDNIIEYRMALWYK